MQAIVIQYNRSYLLLLLTALISLDANCSSKTQPQDRNYSNSYIPYELTAQEEAFLDTLQRRSFLYFWYESNPKNGLVRDRNADWSPASIAATGFGIAAWAVGAERNWISREEAAERTRTLLRFLKKSEQSAEPDATGYQGFFYHFLDMETGKRAWDCELSTIDTAWLLAGIRFAVQYYHQDNPIENEIRSLGDDISYAANWDFFTMPDSGRYKNLVSMGWYPEKGLHHMGWYGYTEALYLYILAAGSGYKKIDRAYNQWLAGYQWFESYPGLEHVGFPHLFAHQWTQLFLDLRGWQDEYMRQKGIDYFENSRRATLSQYEYALENPLNWSSYDSLTWGWTACDGPGPEYNRNGRVFRNYSARGMISSQHIDFDDGTIAPSAAGGSIVYAPEKIIPTLMSMYERFHDKGIWGKYGFVDAFNPTLNWFDKDFLGIDQGPILLMIENFRSGLIWKYAMKDPVIRRGLEKLNFPR